VDDKNAQRRQVSGFHGVKVSHGIDLYISQSSEETVVVSASDEEYRNKIKTVVENGILKIYYDDNKSWGINWGNRKLRAYVSIRNIDQLDASGGSDVMVEGNLRGDKLSMDISGGSDFKGKVDVQELSIDQSGGSDIDITGRASRLNLGSSGGSDFDGYGLMTDVCVIDASGGSDVTISASKEISADASGGSGVAKRD
jgi:hypothetical protein